MNKVAEEEAEGQFDTIVKEAYEITMSKVAEEDGILSEDTVNAIIKEAYDLTMNSVNEDSVLSDLEEITKVAYQHTIDQIAKQ